MANYKALQIKLSYPDIFSVLKDSIVSSFSNLKDIPSEAKSDFVRGGFKNLFNNKKLIRIVVVSLLVVFAIFGISKVAGRFIGSPSKKVEVKGATATQEINREFVFPLKSGKGDEVGRVKYLIEKGELRDEIVVKGQRATAISGRVFLIFTLKISNEFNKAIEMNTKDYVRLSVNGNRDEWLAPDIHNDPVEIQAISTKYTRVGFPINEGDHDLILRVGEIDGEKEEIPLVFN